MAERRWLVCFLLSLRCVLDLALVFGLGLLLGQLACAAPVPSLAAALATLAIARRRLGVGGVLVGLVAFALGAARAHAAVRAYDDAWWQARHTLGAPSRCEARALVVSSPVRTREPLRWDGLLESLSCDEGAVRFSAPLRARLYGGPDDLARGDVLDIVADLGLVQLLHNDDLPDPTPGAARAGAVVSGSVHVAERRGEGSGVLARIDRLRDRVRARIEHTFAPDAVAMGRALVLGESSLDPADDEAFRVSGTAHLLAVSGSHLILVVLGAVRLITALLVRVQPLAARVDVGRGAAASGVAIALAYAEFAGGTGSARRAAVMLALLLLARAFGRRPDIQRALGLSLALLGGIDPLVAFDLSFALSVAATVGLLLFAGPLEERIERRVGYLLGFFARGPLRSSRDRWAGRIAGWCATPVAATLAATALCTPMLACYGASWSMAGVLANLIAVPIGELIALPVCLLHAISSPLPAVERGAALAGSGALDLLRLVARTTASVRVLVLQLPRPGAWQCVLFATGGVALWMAPQHRRRSGAFALCAALLASEGVLARIGRTHGTLRLTALDVGQGDATLVDLPDGSAILIDGGGAAGGGADPGATVVDPVLRMRRRARIDIAVLSHPHPDHFLGLASALPAFGVGAFWDTGQGEAEGAGPVYAALLAGLRARRVPIVRPDRLCGTRRPIGGAWLEVLDPCPGPVPFANANDNSFVIRIGLGGRAALLVGDAEREEENDLLQRGVDLRADFLKVGHHGSRTSSSPRFLAAVSPAAAVISTGVRNRFGHPTQKTLAALSAAGIRTLRTDCHGSVIWETDGHNIEIRTALPGCR